MQRSAPETALQLILPILPLPLNPMVSGEAMTELVSAKCRDLGALVSPQKFESALRGFSGFARGSSYARRWNLIFGRCIISALNGGGRPCLLSGQFRKADPSSVRVAEPFTR